MMHVSATLEYTTLLYRMVQPECMHSRRYPSRVPRKTKPRERKMRSQHFTLNTSLPHLLTNSCTKSPKPVTLLRLLVQLPNFLACAVVPTMTPKSWHFGCASMRTYKHANILNNARAYRTRTQRCGASIRTWDRSQQCQLRSTKTRLLRYPELMQECAYRTRTQRCCASIRICDVLNNAN